MPSTLKSRRSSRRQAPVALGKPGGVTPLIYQYGDTEKNKRGRGHFLPAAAVPAPRAKEVRRRRKCPRPLCYALCYPASFVMFLCYV